MSRPVVIIHGWSDKSSSFGSLRKYVARLRHDDPYVINLADYVTLDDSVRFDDLVAGMHRAWMAAGLPTAPGSTDVVVHSTGGLVIRDWMTTHFSPENAPIKHLVMLAPANFGSPLAHKGRAFYGRIAKGFSGDRLFQTGTHILKGLELASSYSFGLALRDRFSRRVYYGPGRVLCTVLVGNTGYSGIQAAANEDGSDGTVRVSTANLDCDLLEADYSQNPLQPVFRISASNGRTAFRMLDGDNHSTAAFKDGGPVDPDGRSSLARALAVTDAEFGAWCDECALRNEAISQQAEANNDTYRYGYLNLVAHVQDDTGQDVPDYFMEFYAEDEDDGTDRLAGFFHRDVIRSVHAYAGNAAYRSFLIDCTTLYKHIDEITDYLKISLSAIPEIGRHGLVGYRTFNDEDIGGIRLEHAKVRRLFRPHRTLLVELTIRRERTAKLFTIRES